MIQSIKLALLLLATGVALTLGGYQVTTRQPISALIWFSLIAVIAALTALTISGLRSLVTTLCVSASLAALALLSHAVVAPWWRNVYLTDILLGLFCVWMPTGAGIGLITWFLVSLRTLRRKPLG